MDGLGRIKEGANCNSIAAIVLIWELSDIFTKLFYQVKDDFPALVPQEVARFVKVYRSHKLCRNVCSQNSCGNASGISHAYKGHGNAICHFLNIVQECQNFALIFRLVPLM